MNPTIEKYITRWIQIFLIGLLIQFFAHTYITFQIQREGSLRTIVRLRKEILILVWLGVIIQHIHHNWRKEIRISLPIKKLLIVTACTGIIIAIIWRFTAPSLSILILSIRYSLTWFLLAIIWFFLAWIYWQRLQEILHPRWSKTIKTLLILALLWYGIIFFIPSSLEFFGYERFTYEWKVWEAPPAVYYTNINQWLERNQFIFERPTSRWFFLIAFWPLFFMRFIRKKSRKTFILRTGIYWFNVLITFSRAARISWFLQTWLIILLTRDKKQRRQIVLIIVGIFWVLWAVTYYAKDEIINRTYSNLGHTKHTLDAIQMVSEKPIRWRWPGFAWPAAHHWPQATKYNPENQFLQIWLEYGIFGFLWRMAIYLWFHLQWRYAYKALKKNTISKEHQKQYRYIIGLSLGILGLTVEWLFLHSFVDRMIVYPFMLIFGIALAQRYRIKKED